MRLSTSWSLSSTPQDLARGFYALAKSYRYPASLPGELRVCTDALGELLARGAEVADELVPLAYAAQGVRARHYYVVDSLRPFRAGGDVLLVIESLSAAALRREALKTFKRALGPTQQLVVLLADDLAARQEEIAGELSEAGFVWRFCELQEVLFSEQLREHQFQVLPTPHLNYEQTIAHLLLSRGLTRFGRQSSLFRRLAGTLELSANHALFWGEAEVQGQGLSWGPPW